jgi:phytoene dehydrogenase-like protein
VCGPAEAAAFDRYFDWLGRLYRLEMPSFLNRNYDRPSDLALPVRPALELLRMGGLRRLDRVVSRTFADERLRRLFSFQALYAGVAPQLLQSSPLFGTDDDPGGLQVRNRAANVSAASRYSGATALGSTSLWAKPG